MDNPGFLKFKAAAPWVPPDLSERMVNSSGLLGALNLMPKKCSASFQLSGSVAYLRFFTV